MTLCVFIARKTIFIAKRTRLRLAIWRAQSDKQTISLPLPLGTSGSIDPCLAMQQKESSPRKRFFVPLVQNSYLSSSKIMSRLWQFGPPVEHQKEIVWHRGPNSAYCCDCTEAMELWPCGQVTCGIFSFNFWNIWNIQNCPDIYILLAILWYSFKLEKWQNRALRLGFSQPWHWKRTHPRSCAHSGSPVTHGAWAPCVQQVVCFGGNSERSPTQHPLAMDGIGWGPIHGVVWASDRPWRTHPVQPMFEHQNLSLLHGLPCEFAYRILQTLP